MKRKRGVVAAVLLLAMLLSLFGGGIVSAEPQIITTDSELVYDPLAETHSIAYEQHEDGYAVSLDRAEDSVTMDITTVPSVRAADKARLYIRTGVELQPGKTYQVSFSLAAEKAQPEYAVCFDSASEQAAYGTLNGRSIKAGGTDQVTYTITPKEESGELILRLLLGKTEAEGNTLYFSNLAVGEASESKVGENVVLVDDLDYSAPGAVSFWTNTGSGAAVTSDANGKSTTLTVTDKPAAGSAVWEVQLKVATGFKPEPGKAYSISASLNSSAVREYEVCFNEGNVEKGYDALYGLWLEGKSQTLNHRFIVPEDKENPGELVLQFSVGKLKVGEKVTVSDIRVVEATPKYANALPQNFSYNSTWESEEKVQDISGAKTIPTNINWTGSASISSGGDKAGGLTVDGGSATLAINGGGANVYDAYIRIDTGESLKAGATYTVSYDVNTNVTYSGTAEILCGSGSGSEPEKDYAANYSYTLNAGSTNTVQHIFTGKAGGLQIKLQLGKTLSDNVVTVSNLRIEEMTVTPGEPVEVNVTYPNGTLTPTFEGRDNCGALTTSDGNSVTFTVPGVDGWQRALFVNEFCTLKASTEYTVSLVIKADKDAAFNVKFCDGKHFHPGNVAGEFGDKGGTASTGGTTVTNTITPGNDCKLTLQIDLDGVAPGTQVTVGQIKVESNEGEFSVTDYPTVTTLGNFKGRDNCGAITGNGSSATFTVPSCENWRRALFINEICTLDASKQYEVSFKIKADKDIPYEVAYLENDNVDNTTFGAESGTATASEAVVTHTITNAESGPLFLRINLTENKDEHKGTKVTVSDIQVKEVLPSETVEKTIDSFTTSSVWAETGGGCEAKLTRGKNSANLLVWKTNKPNEENATWQAKLYIDTGVPYEAGKAYRVSFDITAEVAQRDFCAIYNTSDTSYNGKFAQTISSGETKTIVSDGLPAGSGNVTVTVEVGKLEGASNNFTIERVKVEEVDLTISTLKKTTGTVTCDTQPGYKANLIREKDSATLDITATPAQGMEVWKTKMFVNTGIQASAGGGCRVTFDVLAENDMDFEVCYNRDGDEKGYSALYGLHAEGGKVQTVEKTFVVAKDGALNIQLSLGLAKAPNKVKVSNLKVERISYTDSGKNALPAEVNLRAPGAASYWAHEDYAVGFTGSDDAITANIKQAPQVGAEPWKIKLFMDTGVKLEPGKYYRVTANVSAAKSQAYEICYNNGGVEMGYDSLGGLQLTAGKLQTAEKVISVPADKKDATNLILQFNLGRTSVANDVTVSGVTVEEVSLSYADMMANGFAYKGSAVDLWTYTDYTATLEGSDSAATVHITGVPSTGAEVWKVKMLVNTGAILSAGKTYLVRADLLAAKGQNYEVCFNNEETEKGFDALYGQTITAGNKTTVEKSISVPATMTDAGELVLQFSVGGAVTNDITVSNVSVQELNFGAGDGKAAPDTVIDLYNAPAAAAGTLNVTREKLSYNITKFSSNSGDNAITISDANLRANDLYTVTFKARADQDMTGAFALRQADGTATVISEPFQLTAEETEYSFTTAERLSAGGVYDLVWCFGSEDNQALGGAVVDISGIAVYCPAETLVVQRSTQNVKVNGKPVKPDMYSISGYNYIKIRDLAMMLNDTDAQFVVRYNPKTNLVSITSGKAYTPVGGELTAGADLSAYCVRSSQDIVVNGKTVNFKAYVFGGHNFLRIRDLNELLGFEVDYIAETDTVAITSPLTPEAQEKAHAYDIFFLPEVDGETQPYVGDTMPYYENGVYYIYYLKDGGDSYNHSVYLATTTDFVTYTEYDDPVLSASREDVQDSWIGTGSVVKADDTYYFFYTGFNSSGSQEYHEKIMVAKGSSPTSFEKVSGWAITPPDELGQKNDFRDPQAYYDPASGTFSLTVTASQGGLARILKYTLGKDLQNVTYDGIIFTDPTGVFWNLECSDTFQIGNKWYLTYSGQDDTLWYAMADSRFGPYSNAARLDGKLFYAAKHVEDGNNTYMVGWARRANSASSTQEVAGWAGNIAVQKVVQQSDGRLALVPVDSIVASFGTQKDLPLGASQATVTAGSDYSYKEAFTSYESFMLRGEFTYSGTGAFGLAFDFNGKEEQYKLISLDPAANKLGLSFNEGTTPITETQAALSANQKHTFTYIQEGSIGIFYLDNQAALLVRLYGVTDKPIYLFAENNSVTFTSLQQYTQ